MRVLRPLSVLFAVLLFLSGRIRWTQFNALYRAATVRKRLRNRRDMPPAAARSYGFSQRTSQSTPICSALGVTWCPVLSSISYMKWS